MKRYILTALVSFGMSFVLCLAEIPLLRRLKAGQNILGYVKEHQVKSGTPTMGGIAFLLSASFSALIFYGWTDRPTLVSVAIGLGFMAVGLIDDLLKLKRRENLGLRAYQKILFQLAVSVIAAVYAYRSGMTKVHIPFCSITVDIGFWIIPLAVFVFLATVNSVNLTDGLDGLAGNTSAVFFAGMGGVILLEKENPSVALLCIALTSALLAYLVFNTNKASVFMGDTGSLGLGGFCACVGIFSGNVLYIAVLGIMFALSSITVIIQVIYYKKTGKRIFRMAPVHHHFQQLGYGEGKISYCYGLITMLISALCILALS